MTPTAVASPRVNKGETKMTIREMLNHVENFNSVAHIAGLNKVELRFDDEFHSWPIVAEDTKQFRKYIKDEYHDFMAMAILNYKEYQFNKEFIVECEDPFGEMHTIRCGFYLRAV